MQDSGRVRGSRVWLFLAKLLITKDHEYSLLALANCYLYKIREDISGEDPFVLKMLLTLKHSWPCYIKATARRPQNLWFIGL